MYLWDQSIKWRGPLVIVLWRSQQTLVETRPKDCTENVEVQNSFERLRKGILTSLTGLVKALGSIWWRLKVGHKAILRSIPLKNVMLLRKEKFALITTFSGQRRLAQRECSLHNFRLNRPWFDSTECQDSSKIALIWLQFTEVKNAVALWVKRLLTTSTYKLALQARIHLTLVPAI